MRSERGEGGSVFGCLGLVIAVALAILLWQLWPEVTGAVKAWLESNQ